MLDSLLSPDGGLAAVLAASFVAATLVPFSSEAVLFGFLQLYPERVATAVAAATLGNTMGGMTTYLLGRLLPGHAPDARAFAWLARYGAPALALAWLPLVGDALCAAAGWLRVHWAAALAFMAAGRLARYLAIAALSA